MENTSWGATLIPAIVIHTQYQKHWSNKSLPVLFRATASADSSALFHAFPSSSAPGDLSSQPCNTPQGLGSPPVSLPRLREPPYDSPGLPCSMIRIDSRLPRRAGIPNASIRRFDARPDLSDLGNSFPGEYPSGLSGLSDRPVILQTIH